MMYLRHSPCWEGSLLFNKLCSMLVAGFHVMDCTTYSAFISWWSCALGLVMKAKKGSTGLILLWRTAPAWGNSTATLTYRLCFGLASTLSHCSMCSLHSTITSLHILLGYKHTTANEQFIASIISANTTLIELHWYAHLNQPSLTTAVPSALQLNSTLRHLTINVNYEKNPSSILLHHSSTPIQQRSPHLHFWSHDEFLGDGRACNLPSTSSIPLRPQHNVPPERYPSPVW